MNHQGTQYQCRHIFATGHRCGSPSLRLEQFCYYHHTTRKPLNKVKSGLKTFELIPPEDRNAIQLNLGEVLRRLAADEIDPKRASLLLYGLSIASGNLARSVPALRDAQPVEEVLDDVALGLVAPPDDRPTQAPDPNPADTSLHDPVGLARLAIDQTVEPMVRYAAAEKLHALTEAEYNAWEASLDQPSAPAYPAPAAPAVPPHLWDAASYEDPDISHPFAQEPQDIVVDAPNSPRYSQNTSRYSMAASS